MHGAGARRRRSRHGGRFRSGICRWKARPWLVTLAVATATGRAPVAGAVVAVSAPSSSNEAAGAGLGDAAIAKVAKILSEDAHAIHRLMLNDETLLAPQVRSLASVAAAVPVALAEAPNIQNRSAAHHSMGATAHYVKEPEGWVRVITLDGWLGSGTLLAALVWVALFAALASLSCCFRARQHEADRSSKGQDDELHEVWVRSATSLKLKRDGQQSWGGWA
eukprot:CAMPEP_0179047456 /NCGR_PEP_ID=MMETSP0796-20121207/19206_1 /TAXON_ID=73915 /ORGANISM="Pyrodinium bahamense, Strain pbaha01" /LENGTH=220 /DNA_ID=CAMNT_0020743901 /DNA_START=8 /DNA_END=670 /DNA_ORIENTATION=+